MGYTKNLTIINRNYPPVPGVTGESAKELAAYLEKERGVRVTIVTVAGMYEGGAVPSCPLGRILKVRSLYDGKRKLRRLFSTFVESYHLVTRARRDTSGPLIVMTDPPFLSFWASLLLSRRKWCLWSMDVYPDAFVAAGVLSEQNWFYRLVRRTILRHPPKGLIALGESQKSFMENAYGMEFPGALLPCGVHKDNSLRNPEWKKNDDKIYFGYCGNLGEAHSAQFVMHFIESLSVEKHRFILSAYGSKAAPVIDAARKSAAVEIVDQVPRAHLSGIDIHLVTLLPRWNNLCVPSKAVSAVCSHSCLLFHGDQNCDTWRMLGEAGWLIRYDGDVRSQIHAFLQDLSLEAIGKKRVAALRISAEVIAQQNTGLRQVAEWLKQ